MTKNEKIRNEVRALSAKELSIFREWFVAFDTAAWDRQIEADIVAGKLDTLANEALADHAAGRSREL